MEQKDDIENAKDLKELNNSEIEKDENESYDGNLNDDNIQKDSHDTKENPKKSLSKTEYIERKKERKRKMRLILKKKKKKKN